MWRQTRVQSDSAVFQADPKRERLGAGQELMPEERGTHAPKLYLHLTALHGRDSPLLPAQEKLFSVSGKCFEISSL